MNGDNSISSVLEQLKNNGRAMTYTKGVSMRPMLKTGRDISVLVPARDVKKGDVVLYKRLRNKKTEFVLHRIIKINRDGTFLIRGDNTFTDETVSRDSIIAELEGFYRKGKYIDCKKSKPYRIYIAVWSPIYPIRRFVCCTLRKVAATIKNKVFHLNDLHLNDIIDWE